MRIFLIPVRKLFDKLYAVKISVTVLLIFVVVSSGAQSYFTTKLKPGPHPVGFKAGVHYDLGRPPIRGQFSAFRKGRAVHISVWYPASPKANHQPMMYGEYLDEVSRMLNPREVTKRTRAEAIHQHNILLSQLGGDSTLFLKHLGPVMNSITRAYRNAALHSGSFPVLIYPESPHLNNILCEYLSSYGYIVVSVSRHGTLTPEFEWQSVKGIETLVQDCQFALSVIRKEFKTAGEELAVMGTGMNASAGLAWMMRNPDVDALVSLEGGILTGYEYGLIQKSPYFDITQVKSPMLVMHSPHESVKPEFIDHYKYADRFMMSLPFMREFYYLNFGVWEKTIPGILGPAPGDTREGFEWMARYTLGFLDWHLKTGTQGRTFFDSTPEQNGVPSGMIVSAVKYAIDVPLSEDELMALNRDEGFGEMLASVQKAIGEDSSAYSFGTFVSVGGKLISSQAYEDGARWAEVFQKVFPQAASAYTMAGRCYLELKKDEHAIVMYSNALDLLPADAYIPQADKEMLRESIRNRLKQLSQ